ncbi:MAG TPA: C-type lectin domain-containing protein, partial [Pseudomonadales bacterium]|nr:C-type lectin domain-containing protein [Pseudomonadales bacterium]
DATIFENPNQPFTQPVDGWGRFVIPTTLNGDYWDNTPVGGIQILAGRSNPAAIQFTAQVAGVYAVDARFWDAHPSSAPSDPLYEVYKVDVNGNAVLVSNDNEAITDDNTGAVKERATVHQIVLAAGEKLVFAVHKGDAGGVGEDEVAANIHISLLATEVVNDGVTYYYNMTTGRYLSLSSSSANWNDAKTAAAGYTINGQTGYLATPTDSTSLQIVRALMQNANVTGTWAGGYQVTTIAEPNSGWLWMDGPNAFKPFSGQWAANEPNNAGEENALGFNAPSADINGFNNIGYNDFNEASEFRYFVEVGDGPQITPVELTSSLSVDSGSAMVFVDPQTVYSVKTGHYYRIPTSSADFEYAQTLTEAATYNDGSSVATGYLARIDDAEELDLINRLMAANNTDGVWVGLQGEAGNNGALNWKWVDSSGAISHFDGSKYYQEVVVENALKEAGWVIRSYDDFEH